MRNGPVDKTSLASSTTWRTLIVAGLLAVPLGAVWAADGIGEFLVPVGTTRVLETSLRARDLVVLGTLVVDAPEARLYAERVYVGPEGSILGAPGADGADATGLAATGASGDRGRSVAIAAVSLVVDAGGRIVGGAGGRGGSAEGRGVVTGGDGGDGGSVLLETATRRMLGHVLPGAGGAGGSGLQVVDAGVVVGKDARAVGGAGGDTGVARLDGKDLPVDPAGVVPAPQALAEPFPSGPLSSFSSLSAFPQYVPLCNDLIDGSNAMAAPGNPSTVVLSAGAGGQACMVVVAASGAPGADCQSGSAAALSAKAVAIAGRGGDGLAIGASGGTGGAAWAGAKGGDGGDGGDCGSGAGGAGTGGGGASATATGGDGGLAGDSPFAPIGGVGGVGGKGGAAYAEAQAGVGGAGGDGTTAGGAGGGGGVAVSTATAGSGGRGGANGAAGGEGGDAEAYGASGKGGKGGNGATKGGNGGGAGKTTQVTAKGGNGGAGAGPGVGGDAATSVDPEGGDGGYPDGVGGDGGDWSVFSIGGDGGIGVGGHPGAVGGSAENVVPFGTGAPGHGPGGNGASGEQSQEVESDGSTGATCGDGCDLGDGPDVPVGPVAVIASLGPLVNIWIGNTLSCQVEHVEDPAVYQFYPPGSVPGDCGTFAAVGGVLYAPDFSRHALGAPPIGGYTPYTPLFQGKSGSGTVADPYVVVTEVRLGATGLEIRETDSYVVGDDHYSTVVEVANSAAVSQDVVLYRAGDCFAGASDFGYGATGITATGSVACTENPNNSPSGQFEEFIPRAGSSARLEDLYSTLWSRIGERTAFPDTCDCTVFQDNSAGLSWSLTVPGFGTATAASDQRFSV